MKVESEREVAQSCLTPSDPMDCSPPGSSVYGIFQAGVLELGAIAFSKILVVKYIQRFISHLITPYNTFGEGNGTPLQYSCLENPMDGGAW